MLSPVSLPQVRSAMRLGGLVLLAGLLAFVPSSCTSTVSPDKRITQYLNSYGWGKAYTGNFFEESYATIGDRVSYIDQMHPGEIRGNQVVQPDGTITVQEVGTVHVAGLTRSEIEAFLSERVSLYYSSNADVSVIISAKPKQYFVLGEVRSEGAAVLDKELNVFDAILKARPQKRSANLGRVRLIRVDPVDPLIIPINFNDMLRGDSTYNVSIMENDIIYVPPTLLAQFAYFLDGLLFPVKQVISGLGSAFFYGRNNNGTYRTLFD
ncbi:MAG: polysaccharide biosynthesis/export family protein [Planctomycetota bacterium]